MSGRPHAEQDDLASAWTVMLERVRERLVQSQQSSHMQQQQRMDEADTMMDIDDLVSPETTHRSYPSYSPPPSSTYEPQDDYDSSDYVDDDVPEDLEDSYGADIATLPLTIHGRYTPYSPPPNNTYEPEDDYDSSDFGDEYYPEDLDHSYETGDRLGDSPTQEQYFHAVTRTAIASPLELDPVHTSTGPSSQPTPPTSFTTFIDNHMRVLFPTHPLYPSPQDTCPMCYDAYNASHAPVLVNGLKPCNAHVFGYSCLRKWFTSGMSNSNKCPLCRTVWFNLRKYEMRQVMRGGLDISRAEEAVTEAASEVLRRQEEQMVVVGPRAPGEPEFHTAAEELVRRYLAWLAEQRRRGWEVDQGPGQSQEPRQSVGWMEWTGNGVKAAGRWARRIWGA